MATFALCGVTTGFVSCPVCFVLGLVGVVLFFYVVLRLWYKRFDSHPAWILSTCCGGVLLILGFFGLRHFHSSIGQSVFEAVFVAGVLVAVVDPLMKWRLLKEVSEGLFTYMIGFDLPAEIRDKLDEIIGGTKLYRPEMTMKLSFDVHQDEAYKEAVRIKVHTSFEVENPTPYAIDYRYPLEFEEAERSQDSVKTRLPGHDGFEPCTLKPDNGVCVPNIEVVTIEPKRNNSSASRFEAEYTQIYPTPGFHLQMFVLPTLRFTVCVEKAPTDLEVITTIPEGQLYYRGYLVKLQKANEDKHETLKQGESITCTKALMKGDSINIRWRKRSSGTAAG